MINKKRIERKLESLLDMYKEETRPKEKLHLLKKINENEKMLGLELTVVDNARTGNSTSEIKYYISVEDKKNEMLKNFTAEEKAYFDSFNEWYEKKLRDAENSIKKVRYAKGNGIYTISEVLMLANQGWKVTEIAAKFGMTQPAISKVILKHLDMEWKELQYKRYNFKQTKRHDLTPQKLATHLNEGMTDTAIGEKYGISQSMVSNIKNRYLYKSYSMKGGKQ